MNYLTIPLKTDVNNSPVLHMAQRSQPYTHTHITKYQGGSNTHTHTHKYTLASTKPSLSETSHQTEGPMK